jgi:hypothetical protein
VQENRKKIERLCDDLKSHNLYVWIDRNNIAPGSNWKDAIRNAIRSGAYFIACFSDEYESRKKTYMNEELILAVEELRQYSLKRIWFIPVLLSECDVPARSIGGGQTLLDLQWVNLYTDWDEGIRRLLTVLKADELREIKGLIDEYAYIYRRRVLDHSDSVLIEHSKKEYINKVHSLNTQFGVWHDPIKLVRN